MQQAVEESKSSPASYYIDASRRQKIKAEAERLDRSESWVIRDAIDLWLKFKAERAA